MVENGGYTQLVYSILLEISYFLFIPLSLQEGQCEDDGRQSAAHESSAEGQTSGPGHAWHLGPYHPTDRHVQLHRPQPYVTVPLQLPSTATSQRL